MILEGLKWVRGHEKNVTEYYPVGLGVTIGLYLLIRVSQVRDLHGLRSTSWCVADILPMSKKEVKERYDLLCHKIPGVLPEDE